MLKRCTVCKKEKGLEHYHNSKTSKDGYGYRCKPCDKKAREKYRDNNRDRFYLVARKKQLKFRYGLSLDEYDNLLLKQDSKCAICRVSTNNIPEKYRKSNFSVDHCHTTGKIRGLLCNQCNRGLGMLGDTLEDIEKVRTYLLKDTH
jgi:hypothetical protein